MKSLESANHLLSTENPAFSDADIRRFRPGEAIGALLVPNIRFDVHTSSSDILKPPDLTRPRGLIKIFPRRDNLILGVGEDNPFVLAETHACSCFILFTFCTDGMPIGIHNHAVLDFEEKITAYRQAFTSQFGSTQETVTLIGGLTENDEIDRHVISTIARELEGVTTVVRPLLDSDNVLLVQASSNGSAGEEFFGPSGLIFIPKQLSANSHNTVICVPESFSDSVKARQQMKELNR